MTTTLTPPDRTESPGQVASSGRSTRSRLPVDPPAPPADPAPPAVAPAPLRRSYGFDRVIAQALCILAAISLGFIVQLALLGALQHVRAQRIAYANLRTTLDFATISVNGRDVNGQPLAPGTSVAILDIPRLKLHEVVAEGTSSDVLANGPGHRRDTVLPGQVGTSVVMGRRAAYGGPFAGLGDLRPGDVITVITGQGTNTFVVLDLRYTGDPQPEPPDPGTGRLVLVTADGAPFFPTDVIRVDADLTSPVQPTATPPVASSALPSSEAAMGTNGTALVPLVLWGQLLVISAGLVVWIRHRTGGWHAWIIGVPVLSALGLAVSDQAVALLPNLM